MEPDLSHTCTVTSVTLTKDPSGRCFVSLTCTEEKPVCETDTAVGIDLGITRRLTIDTALLCLLNYTTFRRQPSCVSSAVDIGSHRYHLIFANCSSETDHRSGGLASHTCPDPRSI